MLKHFKSSPLWLIGLFVLFAEATSAVAAVKLDGWPQQALVIFVIAYSTVVTAIFFLFLWFKPENFYAPSEYGEISPESYVRALRGLPDDAVNAVVTLEDNPFDKEALFSLMEHLISEDVKQHLILISRIGGELDISRPNPNDRTHSYEIVTRQKGISFGTFSPREFLAKLEGTQLVMTYTDTLSAHAGAFSVGTKAEAEAALQEIIKTNPKMKKTLSVSPSYQLETV